MSGTLFNKSIADFAHLADWALEGVSPVPRNPKDVYMWDALLKGEAEPYMHSLFTPMYQSWGKAAREAVFNRLKASAGVLLTLDETVPCSLQITKRSVRLPAELKQAIQEAVSVESPMTTILEKAGITDIEGLSASQHLFNNPEQVVLHTVAQMAAGLLYFWKWENGEPDEAWLNARKAWRRAVRTILELGLEDFDSPALIFTHFLELPMEVVRTFLPAFQAWCNEHMKPEPPRETVWISEYLVEDAQKWLAAQSTPSLIWVDCVALAEKLSATLNIPYYGAGAKFDTDNPVNCIVSIASHGTGKNLQAWHNNLVMAAIASPQIWEQMIARTHRTGQNADTVHFTVYNHSVFGGAFNNAIRQAIVIGDTTGQQQRIVYADYV